MHTTIRRATIQDLKELTSLFDAYRVFYGKESNLDNAEEFLKDRIEAEESIIYIAETQSTISGFVQLYPSFSSTRLSRLWILNDLFVDNRFRGQGISKLLIEASKELCRQTEGCGVQLETEKSNTIGNNLYPKVDFELDEDHNFYFWTNN